MDTYSRTTTIFGRLVDKWKCAKHTCIFISFSATCDDGSMLTASYDIVYRLLYSCIQYNIVCGGKLANYVHISSPIRFLCIMCVLCVCSEENDRWPASEMIALHRLEKQWICVHMREHFKVYSNFSAFKTHIFECKRKYCCCLGFVFVRSPNNIAILNWYSFALSISIHSDRYNCIILTYLSKACKFEMFTSLFSLCWSFTWLPIPLPQVLA